VLRAGEDYESLEQATLCEFRGGTPVAKVSQANAGLIQRDLRRAPERARTLRELSTEALLEICAEAGRHFMESALPLAAGGEAQTPEQYVAALASTSGMPHALCRANMSKIATVFAEMPQILRGLTRGVPPEVLDRGMGVAGGVPVSFAPTCDALGVVLPSNSPGVNSIWMPAIALKTPVVLKPGREEPWTPLRIVRAFLAAGCPREAFSFYPTDHQGAATILERCGRAQLFGDEQTTAAYASNPKIERHGPGRSKVILGADCAGAWHEHLGVLVDSIALNGGRSCVNASAILTPAHADELADALARELARIVPTAVDDPHARLAAFANPKLADFIDGAIERGLAAGGAEDVTARHRAGPRRRELDGATYLLPTLVRCDSIEHPLANTEFLFPFASVVAVPEADVLDVIGPTLVVSAITHDSGVQQRLLASPDVQRLNLGPVPTSRVDWDQPHEGNLFDCLYARRAIHRASGW
jgi:acyl-CoA reductase-like NAD-dependent aldehyde dehydrogenase